MCTVKGSDVRPVTPENDYDIANSMETALKEQKSKEEDTADATGTEVKDEELEEVKEEPEDEELTQVKEEEEDPAPEDEDNDEYENKVREKKFILIDDEEDNQANLPSWQKAAVFGSKTFATEPAQVHDASNRSAQILESFIGSSLCGIMASYSKKWATSMNPDTFKWHMTLEPYNRRYDLDGMYPFQGFIPGTGELVEPTN